MAEINLKQPLAGRFREVNGDHPMTPADDVYVMVLLREGP